MLRLYRGDKTEGAPEKTMVAAGAAESFPYGMRVSPVPPESPTIG